MSLDLLATVRCILYVSSMPARNKIWLMEKRWNPRMQKHWDLLNHPREYRENTGNLALLLLTSTICLGRFQPESESV